MHVQGNEPQPMPTRSDQIAWAAGLFEGEGCLNAFRTKTGKM